MIVCEKSSLFTLTKRLADSMNAVGLQLPFITRETLMSLQNKYAWLYLYKDIFDLITQRKNWLCQLIL